MSTQQSIQYQCPEEKATIGRALHLGRLMAFYPACRHCIHRTDTAGLSARQIKRLTEAHGHKASRPLFHPQGVAGRYLNDLDPPAARKLAAVFAVFLHEKGSGVLCGKWGGAKERRTGKRLLTPVVIGSDGTGWTAELTAAVSEGVRWTGADVVDVGQTTAPCLAFAIKHLQSAGGILLGSDEGTVRVKFWTDDGSPLVAGDELEAVRRLFENGVDRPTRCFGALRRFQADIPYLAELAEHYHALRPLRFVLDTRCRPLVGYVKRLTESLACRPLPCETTPERIPEQIRAENVHFGVRIDEDGERLLLWDERGEPADVGRLLPVVSDLVRTSVPTTDALRTLTGLLVLLSQSDRPLSRVLEDTRGSCSDVWSQQGTISGT